MLKRLVGESRLHRWRDLFIFLAALYFAAMLVFALIERDLLAILIEPLAIWVLPAFLALGLSNKATLIGRVGVPAIILVVLGALVLNGTSRKSVQRPDYMADAIPVADSNEAPWERYKDAAPTVRDIELTLSSGAQLTFRDVPTDVTIAEVKERVWKDYQETVTAWHESERTLPDQLN